MRKWAIRILGSVVLLVVALVAVLAGRTAMFASRQVDVEPVSVEVNTDRAVRNLAEAVRFRTISYGDDARRDRDAFFALNDWIFHTYPKMHAELEREVIREFSLLYTWQGSDVSLEPVLLCAHLDVVPIEEGTEEQWTHPPFSGKNDGTHVWGRGSLDDKGPAIAILEAIEALLESGFSPKRTLIVALGHDEEMGGAGAQEMSTILKNRGIKPAFVLDEGLLIVEEALQGLNSPVALIGISEKGYATLTLTAKGQGGHSSMPPSETSVGILARAIAALEEQPFPSKLEGPVLGMFTFVGPEMEAPFNGVMANLWLFDPILRGIFAEKKSTNALIRTTTAPTMLSGSPKENVLASQAHATVNFRILPGETVESVRTRVQEVIADDRVTIDVLPGANDPTPVSSVDSAAFGIIQRTIREIRPEVVVAPGLMVAATDGRHYVPLGADVYRFSPYKVHVDDLSQLHGTNERMSLDNITRMVAFFQQIILNSQDL